MEVHIIFPIKPVPKKRSSWLIKFLSRLLTKNLNLNGFLNSLPQINNITFNWDAVETVLHILQNFALFADSELATEKDNLPPCTNYPAGYNLVTLIRKKTGLTSTIKCNNDELKLLLELWHCQKATKDNLLSWSNPAPPAGYLIQNEQTETDEIDKQIKQRLLTAFGFNNKKGSVYEFLLEQDLNYLSQRIKEKNITKK